MKEHFRKGFEFWYAIELFRRLLIIVILTASPSNSVRQSYILKIVLILILYTVFSASICNGSCIDVWILETV